MHTLSTYALHSATETLIVKNGSYNYLLGAIALPDDDVTPLYFAASPGKITEIISFIIDVFLNNKNVNIKRATFSDIHTSKLHVNCTQSSILMSTSRHLLDKGANPI